MLANLNAPDPGQQIREMTPEERRKAASQTHIDEKEARALMQQLGACPHRDCDKLFTNDQAYRKHKQQHTVKKPFPCSWDNCSSCFAQRQSMTRHVNCTHLNIRAVSSSSSFFFFPSLLRFFSFCRFVLLFAFQIKCEWPGCTWAFTQKSHRDAHYKIHTGDKPHQCRICGKRFTQVATLNQHKRTHK
jgi:uncharacterized Zn-finger protein